MENKKKFPTQFDFERYSLWWVNRDDDDFAYPIPTFDDLPELLDSQDLLLRAKFYTSRNVELNGYVKGLKDIYFICIFVNGEKILFNRNLPDLAINECKKLARIKGIDDIDQIFPLRYETDLNIANAKVITGIFDVFERVRK